MKKVKYIGDFPSVVIKVGAVRLTFSRGEEKIIGDKEAEKLLQNKDYIVGEEKREFPTEKQVKKVLRKSFLKEIEEDD